MTRPSSHVHSLDRGSVEFKSELGSVSRVSADQLPILKGLSIKRLILAAGSIREPHWHANAVELAYCLSGRALVGILDTESAFSSFLVEAGQMFHVPSGSVHHIENIGDGEATFIIAFRHERPEDFSVRTAFAAMTDAVLGNTFGLPASSFAGMLRSTMHAYIVQREGPPSVPEAAAFNNPHKFDIEGQIAPLSASAGSVRFARAEFWPALKAISMYSLRLSSTGMREPHWHPATAEMGYVDAGRARMTVLDPDGATDTYELGSGDVYFIPPAYPHHIEQLGEEELRILIFFDRPAPADIGYRATGTAFSREVLAAMLGIDPASLPVLPFTPSDPLIVDRINPRDT